MMRLFLFLLLMANVVMLLVLQTYRPSGSEPERLALQKATDRVTVIAPGAAPEATTPAMTATSAASAASAASASLPAANPPAPAVPAPSRVPGKCVEAGDLTAHHAENFEAGLSRLSLPALPVKRIVTPPPSQIVLLPSQASEAAATRRVSQLRELGFRDVSVIRDASVRRWGISLGVFSKPELAEAQLAALRQAGVTDARIDEYPLNSTRLAYQLVGLGEEAMAGLKKLASGFAGVALRDCP